MKKERVFTRCRNLLLAGLFLINLALFAPEAGGYQAGDFFKQATRCTWGKPLQLPAAWCSCKIILFSLGLFLVIECLGTWLVVIQRQRLAWAVYALHCLPSLFFLMGSYYLVKACL